MRVYSTTNVLQKYNLHLNLMANKAVLNLGQESIK